MYPRKAIAYLVIFIFLISTAYLTILIFLTPTASAIYTEKLGYDDGYKHGYSLGTNAGTYDCNKYAKFPVLRKIPSVVVSPGWSVLYKNSYKSGYVDGFCAGYHPSRFPCSRGV